jgi:hypothetical protein
VKRFIRDEAAAAAAAAEATAAAAAAPSPPPSRSSRPTVRVCMSCAAHGVFFISFGSISSHGEGNSVESKGAAYKHFVPLFTVAILAQGTISG